jgi:hypothetical protein
VTPNGTRDGRDRAVPGRPCQHGRGHPPAVAPLPYMNVECPDCGLFPDELTATTVGLRWSSLMRPTPRSRQASGQSKRPRPREGMLSGILFL